MTTNAMYSTAYRTNTCVSNIKRYFVYCKNVNYPQLGVRRIMITAPTKKWIRDNWRSISGTNDYAITKIDQIV